MKKKLLWIFTFLLLAAAGGAAYGLRPKCSLIADEALSHFGIPIEERTDKDFYLKVFQKNPMVTGTSAKRPSLRPCSSRGF